VQPRQAWLVVLAVKPNTAPAPAGAGQARFQFFGLTAPCDRATARGMPAPDHHRSTHNPMLTSRTPRVLNKRHDAIDPDAVYVGRPSKWGNPYAIGRHGTREEVIRRYRRHLYDSGLIGDIAQLAGRDLVCWYAPEPCHADILLELANTAHPDPL
jgi:hypothetical protein